MAKKDLTIDQLCNLIALESKLSPRTTRTVLDSLYKVVLKQLKLNERIYFMDFGAFEIYERPSGDKKMGNFEEGGSIIRYIAPKIKVLFKPSEALERAINEDDFTPPNRRKKNKKSRAQIVREYNERHKNEKPTTEELLVKALNVSQARQENDDWKARQAKK